MGVFMNNLGSNIEITEYKLILLYIIQSVDIPLNNLELTNVVLDCQLMNYFIMQQLLNDLIEDKSIIHASVDDRRIYTLASEGKETLDYFIDRIPIGRKKRIDEYLKNLKPEIQKKVRIISEYVPVSETEYVVNLKAREHSFNLINIDITTGSKKDARLICENWDKNSDSIYQEIVSSLLKKR
jgi:predicted transcriptional regulator/septum formation topological specificity factor MinE